MTAQAFTDVEKALQYFDRTRKRVVQVTETLSDAQWRFQPAPDRWSIAQNVEHMAVVHEYILGTRLGNNLAQGPAPEPGRNSQIIDALVLERIPDRSIKAKAPEPVEPTGTVTITDTLARLSRNYERLAKFVEITPGLREHVLDAPPLRLLTDGAYTTMDGYQWALAVAAHDERHVRQILEVKQDPNYPA
jgi:hypothetical protein